MRLLSHWIKSKKEKYIVTIGTRGSENNKHKILLCEMLKNMLGKKQAEEEWEW